MAYLLIFYSFIYYVFLFSLLLFILFLFQNGLITPEHNIIVQIGKDFVFVFNIH